MNYDHPPPYTGPGPAAPGYPPPNAPGYPPQGYPPQGYPAPAYPVPTDQQPYPNYPPGPPGPYPVQPGYQGYQVPPQPYGPGYGEPPKNRVMKVRISACANGGQAEPFRLPPPRYNDQNSRAGSKCTKELYVVEQGRRDDSGEQACLTACWTALCCCCLWDMMT